MSNPGLVDRNNPVISNIIDVLESNYDIILKEYIQTGKYNDTSNKHTDNTWPLWFKTTSKFPPYLGLHMFSLQYVERSTDPWEKLDPKLFPKTYAIIKDLGIHDIVTSKLRKDTLVPEHQEREGVIRIHLPLIVPEGNLGFGINGEEIRWTEGKCFAFRICHLHKAWNYTKEDRVNVLVDVLE